MDPLSLIYIDQKPHGCSSCPYTTTGIGFVPDYVPLNPKIAFLAEAPGENEQSQRQPMIGGAGWRLTMAINKAGYARHDCIIANVLRCRPNTVKLNGYPTGEMRVLAENHCRQWDNKQNLTLDMGGLNAFNPTHYLITLHPAFINRTYSMKRIFEEDIQKAFRMVERGLKPLVLLGDKATEKIFPNQINVGVTKIRGTNGTLNWKEHLQRG